MVDKKDKITKDKSEIDCSKKHNIHVEFAPGAFDHFDGTQAELDALIAEIQRQADSGELEANSVPLDDDEAWAALSAEEQQIIVDALTGMDPKTRH